MHGYFLINLKRHLCTYLYAPRPHCNVPCHGRLRNYPATTLQLPTQLLPTLLLPIQSPPGKTYYTNRFRCLGSENNIPPNDPAWCHEAAPTYAMQCCENDFCNTERNFKSVLPPPEGESTEEKCKVDIS